HVPQPALVVAQAEDLVKGEGLVAAGRAAAVMAGGRAHRGGAARAPRGRVVEEGAKARDAEAPPGRLPRPAAAVAAVGQEQVQEALPDLRGRRDQVPEEPLEHRPLGAWGTGLRGPIFVRAIVRRNENSRHGGIVPQRRHPWHQRNIFELQLGSRPRAFPHPSPDGTRKTTREITPTPRPPAPTPPSHNGTAAATTPGSPLRPLQPRNDAETDHLRVENEQLRALCAELEEALHEATQPRDGGNGLSAREYDALI